MTRARKGRKGAEERKTAREAMMVSAVAPAITEHAKCVEVEDQYCAVLNYVDFRSENDVGWADSILNERNMPVSIRLDPASVAEIKDGVDMHTKQTRDGLLSTRKTTSQLDDLAREERHGHRILEIMGDQNEKFFMCSISSVMRSESEEALGGDLAYFRSAVEGDGIRFKSINWNHLTGLMAASPLRCPDEDGVAQTVRPFPASTIAHALYAKTSGLDDGVGLLLGSDDAGGVVRLAITERTESRHNSNVVVVGGSGAGKSTLAKLLVLLETAVYGSKVIIIDPEGEFSDLVRALGGEVVTVGGKSSAKISPLQLRALVSDSEQDEGAGDVDDAGDAGKELVLLSTIPFAKSFMRLAFGIGDEDMEVLELGLERAYGKYGITKETTFAEYLGGGLSYPTMVDLRDSLMELADDYEGGAYSENFKRCALKVRSAADGIHSPVWNTRSTFSIESDVVSFSMIDVEDDDRMKAAWYYNILTYAWSEVRMAPKSGRPIRVVIDEAHNCVNPRFPDVADDVKSMVKRIRKRGGGTTIITQEVNDFLNDKIKQQGSAILNNATYKFIGQAEAENIQELANLYGMAPELVNRIKKAHKGNFALFAGTQDRTWLKVHVDKWMLDMFGTGGGR